MAGLLVHVLPAGARAVRERIEALPGAAVHAQAPSGKLVVTLESERSSDILANLTAIQRMPGVLSAVLVSEHSESLTNIDEDIADDDPDHAP
jgi:nitrate reductase NapD